VLEDISELHAFSKPAHTTGPVSSLVLLPELAVLCLLLHAPAPLRLGACWQLTGHARAYACVVAQQSAAAPACWPAVVHAYTHSWPKPQSPLPPAGP